MQVFRDADDTVPDANVCFVPLSDNQENQILPNQYVEGMYEPAVDASIDPSLQPYIPYYGIYDPNAVNPGWMMNELAYQYENTNMPICDYEGSIPPGMSYDAGYQYPIENNADWFAGGDNGSHDPRMMQGFDGAGDYQGACYYGMEAGTYGNSPSPEHAATCVRLLENDMMRMEIRNSSEIDERSDYPLVPSSAGGEPKKFWCDEDPMQILARPGNQKNVEFGPNHGSKQTSSLSFSLSSSLSHPHNSWSASRKHPTSINGRMTEQPENVYPPSDDGATSSPILDMLINANCYNPKEFELNPHNARFFIIKSYSEDDIHRSIKYGIWCSTEYGNRRLDAAYQERNGKGPVYLFFSVNGSGHFCGMAKMSSPVDYQASSGVWAQSKWKGQFVVRWIYVKDVPNSQLRHIRLENNENKPVTNSRDTQEVPPDKGKQVLKILHQYYHTTSIFDDFVHYEKRQLEESIKQNPGSRS